MNGPFVFLYKCHHSEFNETNVDVSHEHNIMHIIKVNVHLVIVSVVSKMCPFPEF
jgi:hypothetical protein